MVDFTSFAVVSCSVRQWTLPAWPRSGCRAGLDFTSFAEVRVLCYTVDIANLHEVRVLCRPLGELSESRLGCYVICLTLLSWLRSGCLLYDELCYLDLGQSVCYMVNFAILIEVRVLVTWWTLLSWLRSGCLLHGELCYLDWGQSVGYMVSFAVLTEVRVFVT